MIGVVFCPKGKKMTFYEAFSVGLMSPNFRGEMSAGLESESLLSNWTRVRVRHFSGLTVPLAAILLISNKHSDVQSGQFHKSTRFTPFRINSLRTESDNE